MNVGAEVVSLRRSLDGPHHFVKGMTNNKGNDDSKFMSWWNIVKIDDSSKLSINDTEESLITYPPHKHLHLMTKSDCIGQAKLDEMNPALMLLVESGTNNCCCFDCSSIKAAEGCGAWMPESDCTCVLQCNCMSFTDTEDARHSTHSFHHLQDLIIVAKVTQHDHSD